MIAIMTMNMAGCTLFSPRHDAYLELSEAIIDLGNDFLWDVMAPMAMRQVPVGAEIDLLNPEDMSSVLRNLSQSEWQILLSRLDGDDLDRIMRLYEAVQ